jgi:spermidine synthase
MKPWRTVEAVETPEGTLALKQRDVRDFLITLSGRVLMSSTAHRSEVALGAAACRGLQAYAAPRVLVGGLGMGFTLRAVLDVLPPGARVTVAELNPVTEAWCQGPLAHLTGNAVSDPRVTVEITDVARAIARAAGGPPGGRYDAIVIDLYVGPDAGTRDGDPLYGRKAVHNAAQALAAGGVFATWGEALDLGYVRRLEKAGFGVKTERPGRGGLRHVVYVAKKGGAASVSRAAPLTRRARG